MSKRSGGEKQEDIWIAHRELAVGPGPPFYERLNELLEGAGFDEFVEGLCARFYHARLGRPSLRPGMYFRALLVGYCEGIDGEGGIAWRVADWRALRRFLLIGLNERTPDHSTISRTRRLIDSDTHGEVFAWVLGLLNRFLWWPVGIQFDVLRLPLTLSSDPCLLCDCPRIGSRLLEDEKHCSWRA